MFKDFKDALAKNAKLIFTGQSTAFVVNVAPDVLWDTFVASFPEDVRQGYVCNCCRQFVKHYGGLVAIDGNKLSSIWGAAAEGYYKGVAEAMEALVLSAPIKDAFITKQANLGTDTSRQMLESGEVQRWDHLFITMPKELVSRDSRSEEAIMGGIRDSKNVFKRSLDELSIDATESILELIAQNSLYKGEENLNTLTTFLKAQKQYAALPDDQKDNFCWKQSTSTVGGAVSRIRNSAIGTLLIDVSANMDLDEAVRRFERVVAPSNYKRPNAVYTKAMIERAEKTLKDLGLTDALNRRFASTDDIKVNNLLFINREKPESGIFADLKTTTKTNPRNFSKVDSVSLSDFIEKVLPFSKDVKILLENRHEPNMVSLIAPTDADAPSMFKWDNAYSWSYNNALADSMKEKVKAAGGNVDGQLRISLNWFNYDDLDLHVYEPSGHHINFSNRYQTSPNGGRLDVDMNAGGGSTRDAVENVIYPHGIKLAEGEYKVVVNNYSLREKIDTGFKVEIEYNGEIFTFATDKMVPHQGNVTVAVFKYSKEAGILFVESQSMTSDITSKEVWGVKTNSFQKASSIMYSPNYWDGQGVGNRHVFFMLEGAKNSGMVRGFFNENLRQDLDEHKKVFEALGSKLNVAQTQDQLSGVGFSTTSRNEFICEVTGKTKRVIKVIV